MSAKTPFTISNSGSHSHDRTLLASLGFADPDKREPLHELALQYLCQRHVCSSVVELACGDSSSWILEPEFTVTTEFHITKGQDQYKTTIGFADILVKCHFLTRKGALRWCEQNFELARGPDYRWPYSFNRLRGVKAFAEQLERFQNRLLVDDFLENRAEAAYELKDCQLSFPDLALPIDAEFRSILIEVKVRPVPVSDILRQLMLYRTYLNVQRTYAITAFEISEDALLMLQKATVGHLQLKTQFEEYCRTQKESGRTAHSPEI